MAIFPGEPGSAGSSLGSSSTCFTREPPRTSGTGFYGLLPSHRCQVTEGNSKHWLQYC